MTASKPPEAPADKLNTIQEAQAVLKTSRSFIYSLNKRGELPFVKLGRATRIRQTELDRLVQAGAAK